MKPCRFVSPEEPRILPGRHVPDDALDDEGIPIHPGDDCKGCQPCEEAHCVVCGAQHVEHGILTCPTCVDGARRKLKVLYGLHKHLVDHARHGGSEGRLEAARPIPGGDATVLLGPGSMGGAVSWAEAYNELAEERCQPKKDTGHKLDERHNEPMPPAMYVASWEDDWRKTLGSPPRKGRATMLSSVEFLLEHLSWAAQNTGAFDSFVTEIGHQVGRLEAVLHDGFRPETGAAPCFRCSGELERKAGAPRLCDHAWLARQAQIHWKEPRFTTINLFQAYPHMREEHQSCDQGGRDDVYECTRCHWQYPEQHYWLAVRAAVEAMREAKSA